MSGPTTVTNATGAAIVGQCAAILDLLDTVETLALDAMDKGQDLLDQCATLDLILDRLADMMMAANTTPAPAPPWD